MKTLIFSLIFGPFLALAQDLDLASCSLPVCDIPAKIQELRQLSVGDRFSYYSELFKKTKDLNDKDSLTNLVEFGQAAYKLSQEVDTEDWMFSAAAQIANRSLQKLLTQPPLKANEFIVYYESFIGDSQASSFSTLTFWMEKLKKFQVAKYAEISELLKFAEAARQISTRLKHEDYTINLASDLIALASQRLLALKPLIEGVYKVKSACKNKDPDCISVSHVSIMIADSFKGIMVSFINDKTEKAVFEFSQTEFLGGKRLKSSHNSNQTINSHFDLLIDPQTQKMEGVLKSTHQPSDLLFSGEKIADTARLYERTEGSPLPDPAQVEGRYNGKITFQTPGLKPDMIAQLTVRTFSPGVYVATMRDKDKGIFLEFTNGGYNLDRGVLTLLSANMSKPTKFTLAFDQLSPRKWRLHGIGHNLQTGTTFDIELTREESE